jgi:hypothetical protein
VKFFLFFFLIILSNQFVIFLLIFYLGSIAVSLLILKQLGTLKSDIGAIRNFRPNFFFNLLPLYFPQNPKHPHFSSLQ